MVDCRSGGGERVDLVNRALKSWGKTWVLGELGVGAATNAGAVRALKIGDELVFVESEKRSQIDGQGMEVKRRHRNNQPKKRRKARKGERTGEAARKNPSSST